jgi:hypothetical protein
MRIFCRYKYLVSKLTAVNIYIMHRTRRYFLSCYFKQRKCFKCKFYVQITYIAYYVITVFSIVTCTSIARQLPQHTWPTIQCLLWSAQGTLLWSARSISVRSDVTKQCIMQAGVFCRSQPKLCFLCCVVRAATI